MEAIVGGLMMMAGGGALVAASAALARQPGSRPLKAELTAAYPADAKIPAELQELLDQLS